VTDATGHQAPPVGGLEEGGLPADESGHEVGPWSPTENGGDTSEPEGFVDARTGSGEGADVFGPDGHPDPEDVYAPPDGDLYDDAYDQDVDEYEVAYDEADEQAADQMYEGPGHRASGSSGIRRRRRRRLGAALAIIVAVLLVIGAVGFINVSHDIHPTGKEGRVVTVSIPNGASTSKIGDLLAKAGVIHGPLVFELYVKLEGAGPLMPGTYRLATNEPYSKVVYDLEQGPPPLVGKLVVPEGFTIHQIAGAVGRLRGIGISSQSFVVAATSGQVRSPYEPAGTNNLEGFLFPATYPVQQGETADDLVQYMVDTFDHYASELDLTAKAAKLHYTPYQVLKVASIVEREAKFDSDRGPIASVIYNRLSLGMPIGAESTLLYGLGDPTGTVNIETRNPYNTLINKGLPPTPISNPGIPSLEAAASPTKTSYLFWVETNPDGKMSYASTQAGFAQLQVDCRKVHLC
jgi:UPF0755 protein